MHLLTIKMAGPFEFLSHLYSITIVVLTVLLLELVILVSSVTGGGSGDRPITTTQYLKFIEEKNPASRYKGGGRGQPSECAVCLSAFEDGEQIRRLKCRHTFHKDCLDTWLQQDWATCPLCRSRVLPEEIILKYRRRLNRDGRDSDGSDEELSLHGSNLHRFF